MFNSTTNLTAILVGMTGAASALFMYSVVISGVVMTCETEGSTDAQPVMSAAEADTTHDEEQELVGVQLLVVERNGSGPSVAKGMRKALDCTASSCSVVAIVPPLLNPSQSMSQAVVSNVDQSGILDVQTHVEPREGTVELRLDAQYRYEQDLPRGLPRDLSRLTREAELRYRSCVNLGAPTLLGNLGGRDGVGPEVWAVVTKGEMPEVREQIEHWNTAITD